MKKTIGLTTLLLSAWAISSCEKNKETTTVEGYRPIYATTEDLNNIEMRTDEPLENPGRIYTYENYLLVNDQSKGIHIYDNAEPASPSHVSFIAIPGNMDFSVRQGILYADNITDLVLVDISQPATPVYVNKIPQVFPVQQFPDEFGPFECADPSRGIVVGWEKTTLTNAKCYK
jgi:hypothetical protein